MTNYMDYITNRPYKTAVYGGLFTREHKLFADGPPHKGHKHFIDHVTFVASGRLLAKIGDAEPVELIGPAFINIDKDIMHEFTALEDAVYYCVFRIPDEWNGDRTLFLHDMTSKFCGSCTGCAVKG